MLHSLDMRTVLFEGAFVCFTIFGIMASLIIVNAQRMELELKEANRKIEILANQDGLTRLFNRRYFDKKLRQEFKRLQRSVQPLSLIMADIDCFKNFNDTYGHQAGDDCSYAPQQEMRLIPCRPDTA